MNQIAFTIILVLALMGCSPRDDRDARNDPITIDKAQIDVAESQKYFPSATRTHLFVLTNISSQNDEANWKRVKALTHRPVRITDGREVLATGQIASIRDGKTEGLNIAFQSPEALEVLEKKLGFTNRTTFTEGCVANMKRIATAARTWAQSHNEVLPPDFSAMKKELGSPAVLVCPLDVGKIDKKVWDWSQLNTNHVTYQIVSPTASGKVPTQVYLRCPVHGLVAYADGSVRKPDTQ